MAVWTALNNCVTIPLRLMRNIKKKVYKKRSAAKSGIIQSQVLGSIDTVDGSDTDKGSRGFTCAAFHWWLCQANESITALADVYEYVRTNFEGCLIVEAEQLMMTSIICFTAFLLILLCFFLQPVRVRVCSRAGISSP